MFQYIMDVSKYNVTEPIEELLDIAAGHPGINIDMWEYESLFGTF